MPILHSHFRAQAQAPDGSTFEVPPSVFLRQGGPVVQVGVSVAQSIATELLGQGAAVPPPVPGLALIDTGASATCIDEGAAQQLGLPVVDVVQVASASHAATMQNVYPIQISVVGMSITIEAPRAIGAPLAAQGLLLLIGRDVLQHCTLVYNGLAGEITLAI